eukprot:SAG31_NODE_92_length_26360_cov_29.601881_8_plen_65_part_00
MAYVTLIQTETLPTSPDVLSRDFYNCVPSCMDGYTAAGTTFNDHCRMRCATASETAKAREMVSL